MAFYFPIAVLFLYAELEASSAIAFAVDSYLSCSLPLTKTTVTITAKTTPATIIQKLSFSCASLIVILHLID